MKVAFLGLGKMGRAVAERLIGASPELTVWNRTASAAGPLTAAGAKVAKTAAEAAAEAEVVFSMLNDDAAVEGVVLGGKNADGERAYDGILKALRPGAVHVSLSTISVKLSRLLTREHYGSGSEFVASPVFGRPNVAAEGKLWLAVGGKDAALARVRPLLETISRGMTVVSDEPWRAHALKIGGNFLITAMIESVSEALVFAEAQGIDPALFLETVNTALFRSPFYEAYGKVMLNPPEEPGATISLGKKDMELFREASWEAGLLTPLADRFASDLQAAGEAGLKDSDWAAGLYQFARSAKHLEQPV
jgi:3-hydroxyisobutyrate dehydrogenase-like beta-hydroxyacid dehydrogenase